MNGTETRYVSVRDADVAYQVIGEGPLDLLYFYGMGSHIEFAWESPAYAEFYTCETLWPDFGPEAFDAAITEFALRHRRFGR